MEGDKAKKAFNKSVEDSLVKKKILILIEKEEVERRIRKQNDWIAKEVGIDWIYDTPLDEMITSD